MNFSQKFFALCTPVLALVLGGCASELSTAGREVRTAIIDPPPACMEVGPVLGHWSGVRSAVGTVPKDTIEQAYVNLRNAVADRGGNFVRIQVEGEIPDNDGPKFAAYGITGVAFRCPTSH